MIWRPLFHHCVILNIFIAGMGSLSLKLKYLLSRDNLSAASICLKEEMWVRMKMLIESFIYLNTVLKAYGITVTVMTKVTRRMIRVGRHCFTSYLKIFHILWTMSCEDLSKPEMLTCFLMPPGYKDEQLGFLHFHSIINLNQTFFSSSFHLA